MIIVEIQPNSKGQYIAGVCIQGETVTFYKHVADTKEEAEKTIRYFVHKFFMKRAKLIGAIISNIAADLPSVELYRLSNKILSYSGAQDIPDVTSALEKCQKHNVEDKIIVPIEIYLWRSYANWIVYSNSMKIKSV